MAAARKSLTTEQLAIVRERLLEGDTRADVADALGIRWRDWRKHTRDDDGLKELLSELKSREEDALVRKLLEAKGPSATIPTLFLLKSRHGYIDAPQKQNDAPTVNVALIQLPKPAASIEEFQALIAPPKAIEPSKEDWDLI